MASITTEQNGYRTIQFIGKDRKRRSVRLGKLSQRQAEGVCAYIEDLAATQQTGGSPLGTTIEWVTSRNDKFHAKLAAVGLVLPRGSMELGTFIDGYLKSRIDVKASTATVLGHTRRNLIEHFGATKPMRDITLGDADAFRLHLKGQGLSENTIRRRCGIAKQFLRAAMRKGLIASNPFSDLKGSVQANVSRYYFLSREDAAKVLAACPDAQWRLLFALSRYGGLRCPSEHMALRWQDVDWENGRFTVRSSKTEHHHGGESRQVPIFPELRPCLLEAFEQAEAGSEYVITRYRDPKMNLRTQFERIIRRAGLEPWPKLFQNLRSTRETELAENHPLHVVCAWIGNSQPVAAKHYLQVTDEHFEQAAKQEKKPVHIPVQSTHEVRRTESGTDRHETTKRPVFQDVSSPLVSVHSEQVGHTGLEPVTSSMSRKRASQLRQWPV